MLFRRGMMRRSRRTRQDSEAILQDGRGWGRVGEDFDCCRNRVLLGRGGGDFLVEVFYRV